MKFKQSKTRWLNLLFTNALLFVEISLSKSKKMQQILFVGFFKFCFRNLQNLLNFSFF